MSLDWYYVYSQRYEALHYALKDSIKDSRFNVKPLFIDQSEFNKVTYNGVGTHFLSGCYIKQEILLKILKTVPLGTYFIFTDADCAVLNNTGLYEFFQMYMNNDIDMVFASEGKTCNIGISLIRASEKTIAFFETVLNRTKEDPTILDQDLINSLFPEFPELSIAHFDSSIIGLSIYYGPRYHRDTLKLVQFLCTNTQDYRINMNDKYKSMEALGVSVNTYIIQALQNGRSPDELAVTIA